MKRLRQSILALVVVAVTIFATTPVALARTSGDESWLFPYFGGEEAATCKSTGAGSNAPIDQYMRALALQESGGDPTVRYSGGGSDASGKYQYISDSWISHMTNYYDPSLLALYPEAYLAPEEVQDALVYLEYTAIGKDIGFDVFKFALNHFYPAALYDPALLDIVVPPNPITPRQYADGVVEKINNGFGSEIPLKYTQAPKFAEYLAKINAAPTNPTPSTSIPGTGCSVNNPTSDNRVVTVAQAELAKNITENAGANCGKGIAKYWSGSTNEDELGSCGADRPWSGAFVSWVFKQANKPFSGGEADGGWLLPTAPAIIQYLRVNGQYAYAQINPFPPQPGDIVVMGGRGEGEGTGIESHVGIVIKVEGSTMTVIEGNADDSVKSNIYDYATDQQINGWGRLTDGE